MNQLTESPKKKSYICQCVLVYERRSLRFGNVLDLILKRLPAAKTLKRCSEVLQQGFMHADKIEVIMKRLERVRFGY
jgi:hypothetical protein